ncbi:hypothetical protein [Mesorhizobium sp. B2-6-5]|uniref:hypothetical protein n=1 Tax=Mesorhizobium sp. B2-6-5 TaxID=2589912 RepID=UPI00112CE24D|nr:hypothetical protein [Mesorhizobium sp. B2-6-5]TPJ34262.1 hypothetical protein FJ432_30020 [Mesorhizobium sp. B2-6-5]
MTNDDLADLAELHADLMRPGADGTVIEEYTAFAEELFTMADGDVAIRAAMTEPKIVDGLLHGLDAAAEYHRLRSKHFLEALGRLQTARGVVVY